MSDSIIAYDPDDAVGEFGWMALPNNFGRDDWALVYTDLPDGIDASPQLRIIERDLYAACDVECEDADQYEWRPYVPCRPPSPPEDWP